MRGRDVLGGEVRSRLLPLILHRRHCSNPDHDESGPEAPRRDAVDAGRDGFRAHTGRHQLNHFLNLEAN